MMDFVLRVAVLEKRGKFISRKFMGNIKIVRGVFDTKLELEHAGVAAGFPSPADDYKG